MSETYQAGDARTKFAHAPSVRQIGIAGDHITLRAACPCGWFGLPRYGRVGWMSGDYARVEAESEAWAHRAEVA